VSGIPVPRAPGLGIEVDEDAVRRLAVDVAVASVGR
jgi:hypothetical protein